MTPNPLSPNNGRLFTAGRFWSTNVSAAVLAGSLGGLVMLVIAGLMVWDNPTRQSLTFALAIVMAFVVGFVSLFPGNLSAAYPYAVLVEEGRGLELRGVLKRVYIPAEDLLDVRASLFTGGYIVRLKRSHRLLTSFLIPLFFGDQLEPLADAILAEIRRTPE
jgi:hypothetical protein